MRDSFMAFPKVWLCKQPNVWGLTVEAWKIILSTVVFHLCWTQFAAQLLLSGHYLVVKGSRKAAGFSYNLIALKTKVWVYLNANTKHIIVISPRPITPVTKFHSLQENVTEQF